MRHYRNVLPPSLGAIREAAENDTATEWHLVQHSAAVADHGQALVRVWRRISRDRVITPAEQAEYDAALAAHVEADTEHVAGDLQSLNNSRQINGMFAEVYATEPTNSLLPSPLTLGEVLA
jgi:hypothetical protein